MDFDRTVTTFTEFFRERGHHLVVGDSLIPPPGDPVLFTTSGMHPLTRYLVGEPHPSGRRLVNRQRCLRTTDLDEVGDHTHLTVFQMLGSWSLGDYPGPQSLHWGFELLRDGYGISPDRLHATVFGGNDEVGPDTGPIRTWEELGVPVEPTRDENWWSNGETGPCGPDSEIFVWTGESPPTGTPTSDPRWVELWNHVMMRYRRHDDGSLHPLGPNRLDTGLGLERLLMVLQGKRSVFDCDVFEPWVRTVGDLWDLDGTSLRVTCDHLRSSIVVIGDGIRPSNTGRGYVLRRLLRRVLTILWRDDPTRSLIDLPSEPIDRTFHQFLQPDPGDVRDVLRGEEERFRSLLHRGRRVLSRRRTDEPLTEDDYRYLHDTHGLPRELVIDLRSERDATHVRNSSGDRA
ncbi:alanine--tRNA ligase-related protein [Pseudonocardia sp. TRM90224]|uniref:alanine--tRNA ligase-related protein n=1 Tax=Pseudonocardia sp. TRM90224 TaxID=2812678 RepID=UPI001E3025BC|nr:alanine--tRNA ligase-related protein [Pseudonocardia sp. TRM90224]